MSLQVPPNGTGQIIDTVTTVAGKERQCNQRPTGGQFALVSAPAAATQATVTQSAGAAGVKNVAALGSFSISTVGTAQTVLFVALRDGATGAGTILWQQQFILPVNTTLSASVAFPDIQGSAATAMTFEFSAAGAAATVQSVSLMGFTTA